MVEGLRAYLLHRGWYVEVLGAWRTDEGCGRYAHHAVGDKGVHTSKQERSCGRLDDGIASLAAVVDRVVRIGLCRTDRLSSCSELEQRFGENSKAR